MSSALVSTSIANMSLSIRNEGATVVRLLIQNENAVHLLLTTSESGTYLSTNMIFACQLNTSAVPARQLGVIIDMDLSLARWSVHRYLLSLSNLPLNVVILVDLHSNTRLFATARMDSSIPFISCLHLVRSVLCCIVYSNLYMTFSPGSADTFTFRCDSPPSIPSTEAPWFEKPAKLSGLARFNPFKRLRTASISTAQQHAQKLVREPPKLHSNRLRRESIAGRA